jgi:diphosphomevalonate decarboxylase
MPPSSSTAIAHPNIAFIKYWGNRDASLRIPSNPSLSMNLDGLHTLTRVTFSLDLSADTLTLNSASLQGEPLQRVSLLLDRIRSLAGLNLHAEVVSENSFPAGAGIASSASAFAALALAASTAAGLELDEPALSRLARTGSGSACRSVPGGFVIWQAGDMAEDSYAYSFAPPNHWNLVDCIALVSEAHKPVGSSQGHSLAETSPLQSARLAGAGERLEACRRAIIEQDFDLLAQVTELDSHLMHAVMLTSKPSLMYWAPASIAVMQRVVELRESGLPTCFTLDAGPNVHVLTLAPYADRLMTELRLIDGVKQVLTASPGGPARLVRR